MSEPPHRATESHQPDSIAVASDHPLIGIIVDQGDREVVRYFTNEQAADEWLASLEVGEHRAPAWAGAWENLDWAETLDELERIRHSSQPTPPIEGL